MSTSETEEYGDFYWTVRTPTHELQIMADRIEVQANGALVAIGHSRSADRREFTVFAWAAGHWELFYAASFINGGSVVVEHWEPNQTGLRASKSGTPRRRTPLGVKQ